MLRYADTHHVGIYRYHASCTVDKNQASSRPLLYKGPAEVLKPGGSEIHHVTGEVLRHTLFHLIMQRDQGESREGEKAIGGL